MTTKKPRTYVAFILDQSGSMESTKAQAITGYNELVQQMKLDGKEQDILASVITFNGNVFEHLWCEPVAQLSEATAEDFICGGGTALFDGWGYAIQKFKDTTDINDENNAYLIYVITDGENNASTHYTKQAIRALVEPLKSKRWTFNLMGCSANYLEEIAKDTAIPISNCAAWSNINAASTKFAMGQNVRSTRAYFDTRKKGLVATEQFYSDNVKCCADFTDPNDALTGGNPMDSLSIGVVDPNMGTVGHCAMPSTPQTTAQTIQDLLKVQAAPMIVLPTSSPYRVRGQNTKTAWTANAAAPRSNGTFRNTTPVDFSKKI